MTQFFQLTEIEIKQVSWDTHQLELRHIREQVFMKEQHVPAELEWDVWDESAQHILALGDGLAIGCARVLPGGIIGRMAVLPEYRRQGVGKALLLAAIAACGNAGCSEARLSAQVQALGFYTQAGFEICSEVYMDAGIPHQDMRKHIS